MLAHDLLVRPRRLLVVLDERVRDRDAQREHLFRSRESGIDVAASPGTSGSSGPRRRAARPRARSRRRRACCARDGARGRRSTAARLPSARRRGAASRTSSPGSGRRAARRASEMPSVNSSTSGSIAISSSARQAVGCDRRPARGCPRTRARGRRAPPASASVRLSDSSSHAIRRQLAPSAAWIASSCCRPSARTRNRLATLAQAISSTRPTVPSSTHSTRPTSPMTSARQRPDVRPDLHVVEHLPREARRQREALRRSSGSMPRDVGVGLLDRHAGLEPRHALVAEVADEELRRGRSGTAGRAAGCGRGSGSRPAARR